NTFQVKVISRLIKNDTVRVLQHHTTNHTTHFFTSAQHFCFLHYIVTTKQHSSQNSAKKWFIYIVYIRRYPLTKLIHQCKIISKKFAILKRQISCCNSGAPFI